MKRAAQQDCSPPSPAYHHGDLRQALVRAGLEILEQGGIAALTLREAARRANVSHAAPYHHFPDKEALLTAIAARGFQIQTEEMELAIENARPPIDGLQSFGMAYVAFAAAHPSLFRLMYSHERNDSSENKEMAESSAAGHRRFIERIRERAGCSEERAQSISLLLWASVHGLAMLWLDRQLRWEGVPSLESLASQMTEMLGVVMRSEPT
jgi:AcrR family transcriptional regulator